mmetsp:Transcript_13568/g.44314  ORF Transcript_13568/g.44314 Transcript_13568/m.44314 type:complete len:203 (+) Transcript_13568:1339-1947(+)
MAVRSVAVATARSSASEETRSFQTGEATSSWRSKGDAATNIRAAADPAALATKPGRPGAAAGKWENVSAPARPWARQCRYSRNRWYAPPGAVGTANAYSTGGPLRGGSYGSVTSRAAQLPPSVSASSRATCGAPDGRRTSTTGTSHTRTPAAGHGATSAQRTAAAVGGATGRNQALCSWGATRSCLSSRPVSSTTVPVGVRT